jgi:hypothetical protein
VSISRAAIALRSQRLPVESQEEGEEEVLEIVEDVVDEHE